MKLLFNIIDIWANILRERLIRHLFKYHVLLPYPCAEFGVYKGTTAKMIHKYCGSRELLLFDSFEGLPEDWNEYFKKGDFKLDKIPELPGIIYEGLFQDSIPRFRHDYNGKLSFINVDCDLYSSCKTVLTGLNDKIVPGTVILFDEYLRGEDTAFQEWMKEYDRVCVYIKNTAHVQAAYTVIK